MPTQGVHEGAEVRVVDRVAPRSTSTATFTIVNTPSRSSAVVAEQGDVGAEDEHDRDDVEDDGHLGCAWFGARARTGEG